MERFRKSSTALLVVALTAGTIGLFALSTAAQEQKAGRKLAFLVGVKEYKHAGLNDLDFPENDVSELASILKPLGFQVVVLTTALGKTNADFNPTGKNMRAQLAKLLEKALVGKRDLIVVGLAGHGLQPGKEAYFCPSDANPNRMETLIGLDDLLKTLDESGVGEKLVLVDACRNDPKIRGRRGIERIDSSALPAQTGVLLSCAPGEFAFEHKSLGNGPVKGHGVFFYHVIEGIKGDAHDSDGEVTWDSLRAYVKKRVPQTVIRLYGKDGGEQRPNDIGNLIGESPELAVARITVPPSRPAEPMPKPQTPPPGPGKEPALLVSPFGEEEVRAARKAWSQYQQIDEERKNSIGMKLTLIPAGEFQMGSTPADVDKVLRFDSSFKKEYAADEQPQHRVRITRPFYLGTYEVTKGEFRKFVDDTGYKTDAETDGKGGWGYTADKDKPFAQRPNFTWRDWGVDQSDESPVVNVSHDDAIAFCEWLGKKEGKQYRLPTEAEWEYACRAGTTSLYYNGDDPESLTKIGNVADAALKEKLRGWTTVSSSDGWAFTATVGQFRPNNFGVFDTTGNALEWCSDWYDKAYYGNSPVSDPTGPASGSDRVYRGGSWYDSAGYCRSAFRGWDSPDYRNNDLGFRVALVPSGK